MSDDYNIKIRASPRSKTIMICVSYFLWIYLGLVHSAITAEAATVLNHTNTMFAVATVGSGLSGGASAAGTISVSGVGGTTIPTKTFLMSKANCTNVRSLFESKGIVAAELPKEPINEMVLRYCDIPSTGTCCTYNLETKLASLSRMQLEKNTKESIGKLSSVLGTRATKFNDFFKELLAKSKKEFHEMFKRTYGVIYEENAYVFSDLFNELENYYTRGKVDLAEAMDSFFNTLYQKMFAVLNSQYKLDDKYLVCVSEHMKELKPFGDVPDKLSVQIKRSFVATRTYEQALAAAAEVARNMQNARPNADCTAALTKMQLCGACKGFTEKPCANYCVNVMKGCLHYYNELDAEWDNFVASMEKVSERLLGPFNIVMVVEPINIKISEAIMNFQETGQDISNQVFQGCGRPLLGPRKKKRSINSSFYQTEPRFFDDIDDSDNFTFDDDETNSVIKTLDGSNKREVDRIKRAAEPAASRELQYEPLQFSNRDDPPANAAVNNGRGKKEQRRNKNKQPKVKNDHDDNEDNKEPVMDKLVKDIRQKVKDSKKFWTNLPFQICNLEEFSQQSGGAEGNCWNGHSIDRYPHPIVTDQHQNPEFSASNTVRQSSLIATQLFALRNAVSHLRNAYNGLDVEWTDVEEPYFGSGSGSGAGVDDEDDDTGSGLSPIDNHPDINNVGINTISGGSSSPGSSTSGTTQNTSSTVHNTNGGGGSVGGVDGDNGTGGDDSSSEKGTTSTSAGTKVPKMSLRRALFTYLFPIYMAWFGSLFCDLL